MSISVKLEGVGALRNALKRKAKQIKAAQRSSVRPATARLRAAITKAAPFDQGELVRSIDHQLGPWGDWRGPGLSSACAPS